MAQIKKACTISSGSCYEILLNYSCNAKCFFCSQEYSTRSIKADKKNILNDIKRGYELGYRRLGLSGGEPLIRPDIVEIVSYGKKMGFEHIKIQTNGIMLADRSLVDGLAKAGVSIVRISVHGHSADIHDFLVHNKGAFDKIMKGIEFLQDKKIKVGINFVINKLNYRLIPQFYKFFIEKGISDFIFIYPLHIGSMKVNRKVLSVPISKVAPFIYDVFKLAKQVGFEAYTLFLNFPPCAIPELSNNIIALDRLNTIVLDPAGVRHDLDEYRDFLKVKKASCKKCFYFDKCPGIDSGYEEIWGFSEFKPIKKINKAQVDFLLKTKSEAVPKFLTDNQKCFLEILKKENNISTARVLQLAKKIPLCKDCNDGNSVLGASRILVKHGIIKKSFKNGTYYWQLGDKIF